MPKKIISLPFKLAKVSKLSFEDQLKLFFITRDYIYDDKDFNLKQKIFIYKTFSTNQSVNDSHLSKIYTLRKDKGLWNIKQWHTEPISQGGTVIVYRDRLVNMPEEAVIKFLEEDLVDQCYYRVRRLSSGDLSDNNFKIDFNRHKQLETIFKQTEEYLASKNIILPTPAGNKYYTQSQFLPKDCWTDDVREYITTQPLIPVKFLWDILSSLQFLNSYQISHSDIKPNNLLYDENDSFFLTDFGLANQFYSSTPYCNKSLDTRLKTISKVAHLPPEYFCLSDLTSSKGIYSNKIDVWSLGISFLLILGYRKTTDGRSMKDILIHKTRDLLATIASDNQDKSIIKTEEWKKFLSIYIDHFPNIVFLKNLLLNMLDPNHEERFSPEVLKGKLLHLFLIEPSIEEIDKHCLIEKFFVKNDHVNPELLDITKNLLYDLQNTDANQHNNVSNALAFIKNEFADYSLR